MKYAWVIKNSDKYFDGLDEKWTNSITEASLFPKKSKATKFVDRNFTSKCIKPYRIMIKTDG